MGPTLKPGHVLRLVKAGKMPAHIDGGKYICQKCGKEMGGATESPDFHENGGYVWCPHCKLQVLYFAVFPSCENYPEGFRIDVSGERKKYPLVLPEFARPLV